MTPLLDARIGAAVTAVSELPEVDLAFAGRIEPSRGVFVLGDLRRSRATSLQGLVSPLRSGLGGKSISLQRPVRVADYLQARGITHEFDHAVSAEGIRAVFAVPWRVDGVVRGVVYGAVRTPRDFGDELIQAAIAIVRDTERALDADAAALGGAEQRPRLRGSQVADVRDAHAEFRAIAAGVADPLLRERLDQACARLGRCLPPAPEPGDAARLTPREGEVLALVAVGCSNAEIAEQLSLRLQTVKSYVKTAMSKLTSRNRVEAVWKAQRMGLLP